MDPLEEAMMEYEADRLEYSYKSCPFDIKPGTKRLLFIDLGANKGLVSKYFYKYYKKRLLNSRNLELHIHAFEPLASKLKTISRIANIQNEFDKVNSNSTANCHELVAWVHDGIVSFSQGTKAFHTNSAVTDVWKDVGGDKGKFEVHNELTCVNISRWIMDKVTKTNYDAVFMKMDVEGSEYTIIDKLIEDDTLAHIDKMFVEFHKRYRFEAEETSIKKCVDKIHKASETILVYNESGRLNRERPASRYKILNR